MKMWLPILLTVLFSACKDSNQGQVDDTPQQPVSSERQLAEPPDMTFQVSGFTDGEAILIGLFTEQQFRISGAPIDANGTVHFKQEQPFQEGLAFLMMPDQSYFQLLISEDQTFTMRTKKGNYVGAMEIEGSVDNELLYDNLRYDLKWQPKVNEANAQLKNLLPVNPEYEEVEARRDDLIAERKQHLQEKFDKHPNALFTKFKLAGQNPDVKNFTTKNGDLDTSRQLYVYRSEFWDNVDFSDERLLYTPVISNKLKRYITELTPQVADSINAATADLVEKVQDYPEYFKYVVNWVTLNYEPGKTSLMDGEGVYHFMVTNYFTYKKATWSDSFEIYSLRRRAQEMGLSLVGQDAQMIAAKDLNGNMASLADMDSPYVLVYIYNPTCEHCIEESPKLVKFYEEWKSKGVDIYAIAVDTQIEEWKQFVTENRMDQFTNVFDPTNAAIYGKYFVDITPEIYVLDPDRKIIAKNLDVEQIAAVIKKDKKK